MEAFYFYGVLLALLIGFVRVCISVSILFSQRAHNLKKIGLCYNPFQGNFTPSNTTTGAKFSKFIFYLFYVLILAPIFSWLSVISFVVGVIARLTNKAPIPECIKEIQFKLANVDLSKDQMIELQTEISKLLGINLRILTGETIDEDDLTYVLKQDKWYIEVCVEPTNKKFSIYSHYPDDYSSQFYSSYEYRFEGTKLFARLLEEHADHYGKLEYQVKDNVVLEGELRKRDSELSERIRVFAKDIEEELKRLREEIEWYEYNDVVVKFFIMSKHPEIFPAKEYKKAVRRELERIKNSTEQLISRARESGAMITENAENNWGDPFTIPENCDESTIAKIRDIFAPESLSKQGISWKELCDRKKIENDLLKFLGEKPNLS